MRDATCYSACSATYKALPHGSNGHADVLVVHALGLQAAHDLDQFLSELRLQINLLRPALNYRLWSKEVTNQIVSIVIPLVLLNMPLTFVAQQIKTPRKLEWQRS